MKTFLTINIILLILSACSYDNAFSRFDISPMRAKSEESIISSKIYNETDIVGVVSYVYLNTVNSEKYQDSEYFYIYLYAKDTKAQISFTLNDVNATLIEELEVNNKFIRLTDSNVTWQKYYFVKFAQQDTDLTLITKIANFSSNAILFQKDD
ncbi:hypothetical protein JHD49_07520 [Sulfurimonas sp. SAG-AH-194-C21]|nr:hypothetical protein [Sulfurimonas sp. SAG-AH-194-C21]MDF1883779.1 hypothetical protein [Sulfurimonas sp. SAG-AH-194-C21]